MKHTKRQYKKANKSSYNKKHKTRKNNKSINNRSKRGGFFNFFSRSQPQYNKVMPADCDPNQLTQLKTEQELHSKYQQCCPKTWYGTKNSSPYCKQIDLNYQAARTARNQANAYQGYSPEEEYQMKQTNYGGRKTRRRH